MRWSPSTGIDALRGIAESGGGLRLGALVTHEQLVADPAVRERYTALADASAIVGSHATRHVGTIGGNVMNASPAMETGGPLICLGAVALLRSQSGERQVSVDELFTAPGKHQRPAGRAADLDRRCRHPPPAPAAATCGSSTAGRWRSRSSARPAWSSLDGWLGRGRAVRDHGAGADHPPRAVRPSRR